MSLIRRKSFTTEQFVEAVKTSYSVAETLRCLQLDVSGANYKGVHRYVKELNLDVSHWTGQGHLRGKSHQWTASRPLSEILVTNSPYLNCSTLKKRLIKEGVLNNSCMVCGLTKWLNKPISLHLDHANGINNDNRIENLRILCPNCHSQTQTFAGRNKKVINWPSDEYLLSVVTADGSCTPIAKQLGIKPETVRNKIRSIKKQFERPL